MYKLPNLVIGNLIAMIPIIQGGMGVGVSLSNLASAVANQGGIGVIATAGIGESESDFYKNYVEANNRALSKELKKARSMTYGILGVNIMVALSNYAELVKTSIKEKIDIIFSGAGLPLNLPKYLINADHKPKLVPIVSSGKAASIIIRKWLTNYNYFPDAIVVEGPMAGGHLGFKKEQLFLEDFALENIIPDVLSSIKPFEDESGRNIPVIAAGGIYTGEDIYRFINMGASGVQMGTRFVTTVECDASDEFKQIYLDSNGSDIKIISSPVGMPGRAIENKFLIDVKSGLKKPFKCSYHCIITCDYKNAPYCIANALINAKNGRFNHGFAFAGANVYKTDKIITVKELIDLLVSEYESAAK